MIENGYIFVHRDVEKTLSLAMAAASCYEKRFKNSSAGRPVNGNVQQICLAVFQELYQLKYPIWPCFPLQD